MPAKHVVSHGLVRRQVADNVVMMPKGTTLYGGEVGALQARAEAFVTTVTATAAKLEIAEVATQAIAAGDPERSTADLMAEARMKGYEGDSCGECGNFTMVRNGTCLKCDTCGATNGCS
jgi:ribonucleoside-diphosphate reductase alpha chain